jgi:Cu/Ag efflux pump CusA
MLIMLAESRHRRCKLSRHPANAGYDLASNILQQRLSQLDGIGQVFIFGGALPAVRVELNPHALAKYGIGLEDVRAARPESRERKRGGPRLVLPFALPPLPDR